MAKKGERKPLVERFWEKVDKKSDNECWLWTSASTGRYGVIWNNREREVYAHRFSWILANGEIPDGMFVCHKCDVPLCVNPTHLFLGTATDNMQDMIRKGRGPNQYGEANPAAKLTEQKVRQIKWLHRIGAGGQAKIAKFYGICRENVRDILKGKTWKHVQEGP